MTDKPKAADQPKPPHPPPQRPKPDEMRKIRESDKPG
jgi:hypothetical protein